MTQKAKKNEKKISFQVKKEKKVKETFGIKIV